MTKKLTKEKAITDDIGMAVGYNLSPWIIELVPASATAIFISDTSSIVGLSLAANAATESAIMYFRH